MPSELLRVERAQLQGGDRRLARFTDVVHEAINNPDALRIMERSSDPAAPPEGQTYIWMSDGTGKGDDGDVLIVGTAGGVTKYTTLFDHDGGAAFP